MSSSLKNEDEISTWEDSVKEEIDISDYDDTDNKTQISPGDLEGFQAQPSFPYRGVCNINTFCFKCDWCRSIISRIEPTISESVAPVYPPPMARATVNLRQETDNNLKPVSGCQLVECPKCMYLFSNLRIHIPLCRGQLRNQHSERDALDSFPTETIKTIETVDIIDEEDANDSPEVSNLIQATGVTMYPTSKHEFSDRKRFKKNSGEKKTSEIKNKLISVSSQFDKNTLIKLPSSEVFSILLNKNNRLKLISEVPVVDISKDKDEATVEVVDNHKSSSNKKKKKKGEILKPLSCDFCPMVFPTNYHLKSHILYFCQMKTKFCNNCFQRFSTNTHLMRHQFSANCCYRKYECVRCNYRYKNKVSLTCHVKKNACQIASFGYSYGNFKKGSIAETELIKFNKEEVANLFCSLCFFGCHNAVKLKYHRNYDCPSKRHVCIVCGRRFISRSQALNHSYINCELDDATPNRC